MDNKKFTIKMIIEVVFAAIGFGLADLISATFFEHSVWATVGFMVAIFLVLFGAEWLIERLIKRHKKRQEELEEERKAEQERLLQLRKKQAEAAAQAEEPAYEMGDMTKEERQAAEIAIAKVFGGATEEDTDEPEESSEDSKEEAYSEDSPSSET